MSLAAKPGTRPNDPHFSSGPTAKRPGWSLAALEAAQIGRFHRSAPSRQRIREVIDRSRAILGVPDSHLIAIVPASDTGAVSMAMWNLLGIIQLYFEDPNGVLIELIFDPETEGVTAENFDEVVV